MTGMGKKIVIAGAGASGMMAAIAAAGGLSEMDGEQGQDAGERGQDKGPAGGYGFARPEDICILEKNERAGRKLLATGNGRCNFTNAKCTSWDYSGAFLLKKETSGFPDSVMVQAPPKRVMEAFFRMGILPREEDEGRVYPYSGQGSSICQALYSKLASLGVEIRCGSVLKRAEALPGGGFHLTLRDGSELTCERLILAVGGKAGCQYGSEGDGYALARELGHRVVKPIPALVQLTADDPDLPSLKGVRVKARAALFEGSEKIRDDRGEIQFTEDTLSGICIFNLSRYVRYSGNPVSAPERYHVGIDFMEEYPEETVLAILRLRQEYLGQREARAFLSGVLHEKLAAVFMQKLGIPAGRKTAELREEDLAALAAMLKNFDVKITGTKSWKDAQVTAGGVDTAEIHRRTLESKLIPGLYFAGELIDVDAPCGGYNLQWAFASGMVAGKAAGMVPGTAGRD